MVKLNDYLYNGDTVLKILKLYSEDLRKESIEAKNQIDMAHSNFLIQISELLMHNDFLTSQSQRIREFYKHMSKEYPYLAFTFRGRIKSLIRAEEKFNRYIVDYIYDYYMKNHEYPTVPMIRERLVCFRDLIAYRIVISMPKCHMKEGQDRREIELEYLYKIANELPEFLEERGFTVEPSGKNQKSFSDKLNESVKLYYKDYIVNRKMSGYESLHITVYDNLARCYTEVQLRTKEMDDFAIIGPANHGGYEEEQKADGAKRSAIPLGECAYFDDAFERLTLLQDLDLSKLDVNMFTAANNVLINDGCGLFRGRLILPFEHLSRFQNDIID